MSSFAGPERLVLAILVVGACASDPDVHLEVTRMTNQKVSLQICDPANPTTPCKTKDVFLTAADAISDVRTIDLFVTDATPRLLLRFTLLNPNFCTQIAIDFPAAVDARVALPADATALATIEACDENCTPGACE